MRLPIVPLVLGQLLAAAALTAQVSPRQAPAAPASNPPATWTADDGARYTAPWHAVFTDGEVEVTRDGVTERLAMGQPIVTGDRVRSLNGRVELRTEHHALFIDAEALLDFPADGVVRLPAGRVRALVVDEGGLSTFGGKPLRIETPTAMVRLIDVGDVSIAVSLGTRGDETLVTALLGRTELTTDREVVVVEPRDTVLARAFDRPVRIDGAPRAGDFDLWVDARVGAGRPTASASYLPAPLTVYSGTLDANGTWGVEPDYGDVWYPTVEVGWRPYSAGSWRYAGYYGWMWVGGGAWAWPTHHYGRWGWRANRWFWAPGPVWGPAWVAWGMAPGYVTWCPLGWNNYPVFSLSVSFGTSGGWYGGGGYYGSYYPWRGWTVMPARHFRHGVHVSHYALDGRRVRDLDGRRFNVYRRPPSSSGEFRGDDWARAGGSGHRAVPRGSQPAYGGQGGRAQGHVADTLGARRGGAGSGRAPGSPASGSRPGEFASGVRRAPDGASRVGSSGVAAAEGSRAATSRYTARTAPQAADGGSERGTAPRTSATPYRRTDTSPWYQAPREGRSQAQEPAVRGRSSVPRTEVLRGASSPYRASASAPRAEVPPSQGPSPGSPSYRRDDAPRSQAYRVPSSPRYDAPRPSVSTVTPHYEAPRRSAPSYQSRSEGAVPSYRNTMPPSPPRYQAPSSQPRQDRSWSAPRSGGEGGGRSYASPRSGGGSYGSNRSAGPSRSGGGGPSSGGGRRAAPRH